MDELATFIRAKYLLTMARGETALHRDWTVAIYGGRIVGIGPSAEFSSESHGRLLTFGHHLVMPGLINAHGHLPMVAYAGKMPAGLPFVDVLFTWMLPIERDFCPEPDFVYHAARAGAWELARFGVTTTAEMYYFVDQMARAFAEAGLRAILGETVMDLVPAPSGLTPQQGIALVQQTAAAYSDRSTLRFAIAPHAHYTASDDLLRECIAAAGASGLHLLMHVNETPEEVRRPSYPGQLNSFYTSRPDCPLPPVLALEQLGIGAAGPVTFAHCVYMTDGEIAALARMGIGVAANPVCNAQIGLGLAPFAAFAASDIPVGLATDGPLTNDRLDLFSQLLPALTLTRGRAGDPAAMSEEQAVRMVTLDAARALHLGGETGSLEVGKAADVIALDLSAHPRAISYLEADNPFAYLVKLAAAEHVAMTMVAGQIVYPAPPPQLPHGYIEQRERVGAWQPMEEKSA